jgi:hypothetical protein
MKALCSHSPGEWITYLACASTGLAHVRHTHTKIRARQDQVASYEVIDWWGKVIHREGSWKTTQQRSEHFFQFANLLCINSGCSRIIAMTVV